VLSHLNTDDFMGTYSFVHAIDDAGQAWGYSSKPGSGIDFTRAVRWDSTGASFALPDLGTDSNGFSRSAVYGVNHTGQQVGYALRFMNDVNLGSRAVRWDSASVIVELGNLGADSTGSTYAAARAINDSGEAVGSASRYDAGTFRGIRAARWDRAGGVLEMENLGTDSTGFTTSFAYHINASGQSAGWADRYVAGDRKGRRAVRWESDGAATELANLGTDSAGFAQSEVYGLNDSGQAAGYASRYVANSWRLRAVRWDADGAAIELQNLGLSGSSVAYDINASGHVVGTQEHRGLNGESPFTRAAYWPPLGPALDLNTLIDPASGWVLTEARAISDTGWIAGMGTFDADGPGPLAPYDRLFLLQVPEPATMAALAPALLLLHVRSRRLRS
jgi:uncharacterized membrane protein